MKIITGIAFVAVVLAPAASGAEPSALPVPPHPLVVVAEKVCRQDLPRACEELVKLAWAAAGRTIGDSIRLLWLGVLRSLGNNDEAGARKGIAQILILDRSAKPPSDAPPRLGELLEEARVQVPSAEPSRNERPRPERDRRTAAERKPEPEVLLGAAQALYDILEVEGAAIVIEVTRSSSLLTKAQRAQVAVWSGVLKMELESEGEAAVRSMFMDALEMDRSVRLPNHVPPKTVSVFLEVKATLVLPPPPTAEPARISAPLPPPIAKKPAPEKQKPPPVGLETWAIVTGSAGAAFLVGGAVAGAVGLSAYEAEKVASATGNWTGYVQNRDAAATAVITSNVLYGVGAIALVGGVILFLNRPGSTTVAPSVAPGKVSLTVGGNF